MELTIQKWVLQEENEVLQKGRVFIMLLLFILFNTLLYVPSKPDLHRMLPWVRISFPNVDYGLFNRTVHETIHFPKWRFYFGLKLDLHTFSNIHCNPIHIFNKNRSRVGLYVSPDGFRVIGFNIEYGTYIVKYYRTQDLVTSIKSLHWR